MRTPALSAELLVCWILCCMLAWTGCEAVREVETVDGPEAPEVAQGLSGYLVTDDGLGRKEDAAIVAVVLPTATPRTVLSRARTPEGYGPTTHAVSGPDDQGRVAYVEDYIFVANDKDRRHSLKAVQLDGTGEMQLFSRAGDAMWATSAAGKGEIGSHIALAPSGGRAALISRVEGQQMPKALLSVGRIEIWDLDDKAGWQTEIRALDEPMSWFPDGKRLAYSNLTPLTELPEEAIGLEEFETYFGEQWDRLPAIYVLDVESGKSEFLCVGWRPIVSTDGKTVAIGGWGRKEYAWLLLDLESGTANALNLPGIAGDVVGLSDDKAIYWGLPTTGTRVRYTKNNSPLSGSKLMLSIKVADLQSGRFATLVPYVDPRSQVSFGLAPKRD